MTAMPATPEPLTDAALDVLRADLDGWRVASTGLSQTFRFADFRTAIAFLVRLAFEAEAMNHHPELENVYDRVTALDADLARRISACADLFRS